jgi:DNA-binding winged helix-turn-helix (wHTH) protein/tetratricopeptide (TPR) repeat protein
MDKCKYAFSEFTFDASTGTLKRRDREQRLPEQSARLLEILLEQANELVTRERLRDALWPDEEFLDYDQGINTAINRLRNSLREGPRTPQYIRTIPKRGYSFHAKVSLVVEDNQRADTPLSLAVVPAPVTVSPGPPLSTLQSTDLPNDVTGSVSIPNSSDADMPSLATANHGRMSHWTLRAGLLAIVILTAAAVGIAHIRSSRALASSAIRLGVAPFRVSEDAQSQELGDTFRLEITDAVSRLPGVQVHAAGFELNRHNATDLPLLSRELNLDDLLLGSIIQQGDIYDLKFELVRADDAIHLASFEYSGARHDLPSIRDRLQNDLFHYLQSRTATVQTINGSSNDPQAYEFYLRGTSHILDRRPSSLNEAVKDFQQAVAHDPNFASAYAGLAASYLKLSPYETGTDQVSMRKAQSFARQAISLDPLLARAHAVLGYSMYHKDWNFALGESELRTAIRLDPTQADYHDWLALLLTYEGRFDEGLEQVGLARADDPRYPPVYAIEGHLASSARSNARAIAASKTYVSMLPELPNTHDTMAWSYFDAGQYKEAIAEWRQMAVLENDEDRVALEDKGLKVLTTEGIRGYARLRLDAIKNKRGTAQGNDFVPAEWYACSGDHEMAIDELTRMVSMHDPAMIQLAVNPILDSLHRDPRFLTLLAKVGLTLPQSVRDSNSHLCEVA